MAKILFIDDNQDVGKFTKDKIEENPHHSVDWIREDSWGRAASIFEAYPADKTWDLLILDIEYPTDSWGGIWLYTHLIKKGFEKRWNGRVIVYSQYFVDNINWEKVDDVQLITLRGFLNSANISYDCALSNQDFDRATLNEKIEEVLRR